ncbi:HAD family hydrolase [Cellulomonas hominis]|uniref:HAD family hydrolase n=1 Tax=Cellulomonas hominis TaxID=156981 RepID=UPI001B97D4AE|nr:HAD family hydrolase [Cellulomonas hominis]VTR78556.1 Phosphorylated carbohydrates phosphatase [Cellulomonas hominis]
MSLRPDDTAAVTAPGTATLPAAVLWDMDGTLVNTEPLWMAAETELVESWGGTWTHEDGLTLVGNPMKVSGAILQSRGVGLTVDEIVDFLNGRVAAAVAERTPWQPGARELLTALAEAGVTQALVTSSYRELADPFARVAGVFAAVVAGDEVERPKPDPQPYLLAAERLGVDIADCVVVEDSPAGITSGVASGAHVLAVEVFRELPDLPGLSTTGSLTDVTVADLGSIGAGKVLDLLH